MCNSDWLLAGHSCSVNTLLVKISNQVYSKFENILSWGGSWLTNWAKIINLSSSVHCYSIFILFWFLFNIDCFQPFMSRKNATEAYFTGELEQEVRHRGMVDQALFLLDESREVIMKDIDKMRRLEVYPHPPEDCTPKCKEKGKYIIGFEIGNERHLY